MKRDFNVIIEKDEDGFYVATVPSLKGCHTQAKSLDVLMQRTKEAIELCLEEETNVIYPYDFVGVQKITINEPSANYTAASSTESESIKNTARTAPRAVSGTKLYAVQDKKGQFADVPTYKRLRDAELKKKNKKEKGK
jgi:predicted RNase H-like HicB family nuclease